MWLLGMELRTSELGLDYLWLIVLDDKMIIIINTGELTIIKGRKVF